jgi:hypothetical protein
MIKIKLPISRDEEQFINITYRKLKDEILYNPE